MYAITVAEEFQVAEVVLGLGASHTTLMNTHWDAVNHLTGRTRSETPSSGLATGSGAPAPMPCC